MSHRFHPTIIREYDIRGIVGQTLAVEDSLNLGKAFGTMVARAGGNRIVVGYDGRTHSPAFEEALVEGLVSTGATVERVGLGPTPMVYFAAASRDSDACIMVTGSHNPADQNGFKMQMSKRLTGGGPVYGEGIRKLATLAAEGDFVLGTGSSTQVDVQDAYVSRMLQDYKGGKPLNIVWDCGNGAAGEIVEKLVAKLPGTHTILFGDIDGRFPNHHPDPTEPHNLIDLQKEVAARKADLGIAFDGDADRIGAIDGQGRIVAGDQLLALYATEVLKTHPGATVIADVKASQVLFNHVSVLGGKPLMWKTGHSLIKVKMAETHAPLAGEMSGHIYFADGYYGYDDAIYAAVRLVSQLARSDQSLGAWLDTLPRTYCTPELRFPVDESLKFKVVEDVKARLKAAQATVDEIDGVRVSTPDGWWLVRASNTQAALIVRAESLTPEGLDRLKKAVTDQLQSCGLNTPLAA